MAFAAAQIIFTPKTERWIREQIGAENLARFREYLLVTERSDDVMRIIETNTRIAKKFGETDVKTRDKFRVIAKSLHRNDAGQLYILPRDIEAYPRELARIEEWAAAKRVYHKTGE